MNCGRRLCRPITPFGLAVNCDRGIFAWQDFCKRESRNSVPRWAWETCKKGPFTTLGSKIVFWLHLVLAIIQRDKTPIHTAGWFSMGFASQEYFDAYTIVQSKWSKETLGFSLIAIQEQNYEINYYPCDTQ